MGLSRRSWHWDVLTGVVVYSVTTLPVALGLSLAVTPGILVQRSDPDPTLLVSCGYHDGGHFLSVVTNGYSFDPKQQSTVAFFPGYPLVAWIVDRLTGCSPRVALLVTANAAFVAALSLLSAYLRVGQNPSPGPSPEKGGEEESNKPPAPPSFSGKGAGGLGSSLTRLVTLFAVGFWPVGFFFRMAYSESMFFAAIVLLMLGLARRWPAGVLAVVAGATTGIRAVGVAAAVAVAVHILSDPARGPLRKRLLTVTLLGPLCCWGLLAFMGYQYARFETPFAFVQTQRHWVLYEPETPSVAEHWERLATAEPVWNNYVPTSRRYWRQVDEHGNPFLGLAFWNPIFLVFSVAAVGFGCYRGWLTRAEVVLGFGLLLIAYVSRADEMSMVSQARFASVVAPVYVVFGRGFARLSPAVSWVVFGVFAALLTVWTGLFAAAWSLI